MSALLIITGIAIALGCMAIRSKPSDERLYLALQIEDSAGEIIARPRLLGEAGRPLSMMLRDPAHPDLARLELELKPERAGDAYRIQMTVALPGQAGQGSGELSLAHGEERCLQLDGWGAACPLSVKLLLMRVDSPEFEAFVGLAPREART
jgi:hypothetical protein